ncbi:hypothetical protein TeGR_g12713 [Tetraparma gracilis]|uniref:Uncharacterized protein n=1 Tax=Tetraparma gracilis TaxID=2962635 RepID=A0ABQ6M871_9STRA|nr:hypothetical protein TeGR_g12713 [Tetraparma gracilis]
MPLVKRQLDHPLLYGDPKLYQSSPNDQVLANINMSAMTGSLAQFGECAKKYSDPLFFFSEWQKQEIARLDLLDAERAQKKAEKKARRAKEKELKAKERGLNKEVTKKKQLNWRNRYVNDDVGGTTVVQDAPSQGLNSLVSQTKMNRADLQMGQDGVGAVGQALRAAPAAGGGAPAPAVPAAPAARPAPPAAPSGAGRPAPPPKPAPGKPAPPPKPAGGAAGRPPPPPKPAPGAPDGGGGGARPPPPPRPAAAPEPAYDAEPAYEQEVQQGYQDPAQYAAAPAPAASRPPPPPKPAPEPAKPK